MAKNIFGGPPNDNSVTFSWQEWFKNVYVAINTPSYKIKAGVPVLADIPVGTWTMYKDSSGGTLKIYANDSGTLKSVSLV